MAANLHPSVDPPETGKESAGAASLIGAPEENPERRWPAPRTPPETVNGTTGNPLVEAVLGASGGQELTPEEHAQAEVRAYFHALERGGGRPPPYDHAREVADFQRAATEVIVGRVAR